MKKRLLNLLLILCIVVFLGSLSFLLYYFFGAHKAQNEVQELVEIKETGQLETNQKEQAKKLGIRDKYYKLYELNHDFAAWICVKGTKIDYPVMQNKKDSEYYIHRNFKREEDPNGLPFLDKNCDLTNPQSNLFVYGHHMKSGIMFAGLLDYKDKEFYEKHKIIDFDTLYESGKYEIVSAFYTQAQRNKGPFSVYDYAGDLGKKEYANLITQVKNLSQYDTGITPDYGQRLLVLSTCSYHTENGRFVVVAVKKKSDRMEK